MHEISHSKPWILPEDIALTSDVLRAGHLSSWTVAERLANELSKKARASDCRLYASGTLALRAALLGLDLPLGARVGIPAFTCGDVAMAVFNASMTPVVLDCASSGNLDVDAAMQAYSAGKLDAVVVTHQFGVVSRELSRICALLPTIEDCAHVPPGQYLPGSAFSIGSLEGTKLLGAGEGGYLIGFGRDLPSNPLALLGEGMSDILAQLALSQLDRLPRNLEIREDIARAYSDAIGNGRVLSGERGAWFRFLICLSGEEAVARAIIEATAQNIVLRRPIMPGTLNRLLDQDAATTADRLWSSVVSVPIYPGLQENEIDRVLAYLRRLSCWA